MKSFLDEMFRKGPRIVRPDQEEEQGEKRPKREKKIMKHWKRAAIGIAHRRGGRSDRHPVGVYHQ